MIRLFRRRDRDPLPTEVEISDYLAVLIAPTEHAGPHPYDTTSERTGT